MQLILEHSTAYLLVCLLVAIGYAVFLYYKSSRIEASSPVKWFMGTLRAFAVFVLCFLLLGPMFKAVTPELERPILIWLQDDSGSLSAVADSSVYRSSYLEKTAALLERMSTDFDVERLSFGHQLHTDSAIQFNQQQTDFSGPIRAIESRYYGRNIGAVVLASDGIYNRGVSPLYAARSIQAPIYTVAMGDTTVYKDVVLDRVVHNAIAYEGNAFPVQVVVKGEGVGAENLLLEIKSKDQVIRDTVQLISGISKNVYEVNAEEVGLQKVSVQVQPIDGELTERNNRETVYVEVLKGRQNILVLGQGAHPDLGMFRTALEKTQLYEVDIQYEHEFDGQFDDYNLVILHNLPSSGRIPSWLGSLKHAEVPFFAVLGEQTDVKGLNKMKLGVRIGGNRNNVNQVQVSTNGDFKTFSLDQDQLSLLPELPPLIGPFGSYSLNRSSEALLTQRIGTINTEAPLLWFSQWEDRTVGFVAGEGWWRWHLQAGLKGGNAASLDLLLRRIVQYLATKEEKSRFRVNTKQKVMAYEEVKFEAELYDAVYEMVEGAEINLTVKNEAGDEFPVVFSPGGNNYEVNLGAMPPGQYSYTASTLWNGETFTTSGVFVVVAVYQEMVNLKADHAVLFRIAKEHDGAMVYSDQVDQLEALINANPRIKSISHEFTDYIDLVEWKWIFAAVMALLTLEWFFRKRAGAY